MPEVETPVSLPNPIYFVFMAFLKPAWFPALQIGMLVAAHYLQRRDFFMHFTLNQIAVVAVVVSVVYAWSISSGVCDTLAAVRPMIQKAGEKCETK